MRSARAIDSILIRAKTQRDKKIQFSDECTKAKIDQICEYISYKVDRGNVKKKKTKPQNAEKNKEVANIRQEKTAEACPHL